MFRDQIVAVEDGNPSAARTCDCKISRLTCVTKLYLDDCEVLLRPIAVEVCFRISCRRIKNADNFHGDAMITGIVRGENNAPHRPVRKNPFGVRRNNDGDVVCVMRHVVALS